MHAEDFIIDEGSHRETVKALGKCLPKTHAVTSLAFIKKAINPIYASALVVSSQQKEVFRVLDLVAKQKTYSLQTLPSPVYIIPQK